LLGAGLNPRVRHVLDILNAVATLLVLQLRLFRLLLQLLVRIVRVIAELLLTLELALRWNVGETLLELALISLMPLWRRRGGENVLHGPLDVPAIQCLGAKVWRGAVEQRRVGTSPNK
jgi:hypothetical protein